MILISNCSEPRVLQIFLRHQILSLLRNELVEKNHFFHLKDIDYNSEAFVDKKFSINEPLTNFVPSIRKSSFQIDSRPKLHQSGDGFDFFLVFKFKFNCSVTALNLNIQSFWGYISRTGSNKILGDGSFILSIKDLHFELNHTYVRLFLDELQPKNQIVN